jgi:hypothetical protein
MMRTPITHDPTLNETHLASATNNPAAPHHARLTTPSDNTPWTATAPGKRSVPQTAARARIRGDGLASGRLFLAIDGVTGPVGGDLAKPVAPDRSRAALDHTEGRSLRRGRHQDPPPGLAAVGGLRSVLIPR